MWFWSRIVEIQKFVSHGATRGLRGMYSSSACHGSCRLLGLWARVWQFGYNKKMKLTNLIIYIRLNLDIRFNKGMKLTAFFLLGMAMGLGKASTTTTLTEPSPRHVPPSSNSGILNTITDIVVFLYLAPHHPDPPIFFFTLHNYQFDGTNNQLRLWWNWEKKLFHRPPIIYNIYH